MFEKGKKYRIYYKTIDSHSIVFVKNISSCGNHLKITIDKGSEQIVKLNSNKSSFDAKGNIYYGCSSDDIIK